MKLVFTPFLLLITYFSYSQYQNQDSLLSQSKIEFYNLNYNKSYSLAANAKKIAISQNDNKTLLHSKIYIAKSLLEKGSYQKALLEIKDLEHNSTYDLASRIDIARIKGKIFKEMNLYEAAYLEFQHQLKLSKHLNQNEKYLSELKAHESLMKLYLKTGNKDSVWDHLDQQIKLLGHINQTTEPTTFYKIHLHLANHYLNESKIDSAIEYINKAEIIINNHNISYLFPFYLTKAKLESINGNSNNCEELLNKALHNTKVLGKKREELNVYKEYIYFNNNTDKKVNYIKAYNQLNDSINFENNLLNDTAYKLLIKKTESKNNIIIIYCLTSTVILLILTGIWLYKKYFIKPIYINETNLDLSNNSVIDDNKFRHLMELVVSNDPKFLILFKELYPNFIQNIKLINPHVRSSELIFLAMCYLNLSTKDIAEYTFVTVRAVQIRKNRLRKKLNITSNVDFNSAVRNLDQ